MILGFKEQFVEKIKDGSKIHTIRPDEGKRWKAGMDIQFATGVRTPDYNQFHEGKCIAVQSIAISWSNIQVVVDDVLLTTDQMMDIAANDGFDSLGDFMNWFEDNYPANSYFEGRLIHWTDMVYEQAND